MEACYLNNLEKHAVRPSLRITSNRLLSAEEIDSAFKVIEEVSSDVLK